MFRLALELGMTVGELESKMAPSELKEWIAYYNIEPFGSDVEGYRHALGVTVFVNANRDSKTKTSPFKLTDFFIGGDKKDKSEMSYKEYKEFKKAHLK